MIRQYLSGAIAAEKALEQHLRTIAAEGDDAEVQLAFAAFADEAKSRLSRLQSRLAALPGDQPEGRNPFASLLDIVPVPQAGNTLEERLVQNLVNAFSLQRGACALFETLAHAAQAGADQVTEQLAREIQAEHSRAAEKLFRFLPTRSKIAFNVLTAHEVNPAIETKVGL